MSVVAVAGVCVCGGGVGLINGAKRWESLHSKFCTTTLVYSFSSLIHVHVGVNNINNLLWQSPEHFPKRLDGTLEIAL